MAGSAEAMGNASWLVQTVQGLVTAVCALLAAVLVTHAPPLLTPCSCRPRCSQAPVMRALLGGCAQVWAWRCGRTTGCAGRARTWRRPRPPHPGRARDPQPTRPALAAPRATWRATSHCACGSLLVSNRRPPAALESNAHPPTAHRHSHAHVPCPAVRPRCRLPAASCRLPPDGRLLPTQHLPACLPASLHNTSYLPTHPPTHPPNCLLTCLHGSLPGYLLVLHIAVMVSFTRNAPDVAALCATSAAELKAVAEHKVLPSL